MEPLTPPPKLISQISPIFLPWFFQKAGSATFRPTDKSVNFHACARSLAFIRGPARIASGRLAKKKGSRQNSPQQVFLSATNEPHRYNTAQSRPWPVRHCCIRRLRHPRAEKVLNVHTTLAPPVPHRRGFFLAHGEMVQEGKSPDFSHHEKHQPHPSGAPAPHPSCA